jgi:hypothetical protein
MKSRGGRRVTWIDPREKESDGYKKDEQDRRSISDHTERSSVCARQGSRMTSRGSLLFSFSWQRTRPAQQAWSNKHVALGLAFLFSFIPPQPSNTQREVEFKKNHYLPASRSSLVPDSHPTLRTVFLHLPTLVLGDHS